MNYQEGYKVRLNNGKRVELVNATGMASGCTSCAVGCQDCPRTESGRLVCVAASSPGATMMFKYIK